MLPAAGKRIILVSDNCIGAAARLKRILPSLQVQAEVISEKSENIPILLAERPVDALILSREEFDLASEITERSYAGVLVLTDALSLEDILPACMAAGVLIAEEDRLEEALPNLLALCARLHLLRQRANILRRKLDDTRLVSRAKLLLMSRLKMSESEAHRYIEKTAMDSGVKRREVAESIIRTYEV